jgi:hypothetical protein
LGWKQAETPLQICLEHTTVAAAAVLAATFLVALGFGAAGAAGAALAVVVPAEGADVVSAAQAGTMVRANNSNRYFMSLSLYDGLTKNAVFTTQREPYPAAVGFALSLRRD